MINLLKLCIILCGYLQQLQAIDVGGEDSPGYISRRWYAHQATFTWMGLLMKKDYVPPEHLLRSSTLIILINDGLAIGLAKDIVDLDPETTEAMFWLANGTAWHSDVDRYEVHPDHYAGRQALALVFLIPSTQFFDIQGLPIIWTRSNSAPSPATIVGLSQDIGIIHQTQKQVVTCDKIHCDAFYFAIGIGGLGCSSCSRWIHFHPYREWIQENSRPYLRSSRADDGMYDYYEDLDQELITKLFKDKDRKELGWTQAYRELGSCWGSSGNWGTYVYREQMHFVSRRDGTYASYALSMYDLIYKQYTCVTLWATSKARSRVRWWTTKGFEQDDIDYYVKKVPISVDGKISPKIIFLMDKYRKYHDENIRVNHLEFQFSFDQEVELEIRAYAKK